MTVVPLDCPEVGRRAAMAARPRWIRVGLLGLARSAPRWRAWPSPDRLRVAPASRSRRARPRSPAPRTAPAVIAVTTDAEAVVRRHARRHRRGPRRPRTGADARPGGDCPGHPVVTANKPSWRTTKTSSSKRRRAPASHCGSRPASWPACRSSAPLPAARYAVPSHVASPASSTARRTSSCRRMPDGSSDYGSAPGRGATSRLRRAGSVEGRRRG